MNAPAPIPPDPPQEIAPLPASSPLPKGHARPTTSPLLAPADAAPAKREVPRPRSSHREPSERIARLRPEASPVARERHSRREGRAPRVLLAATAAAALLALIATGCEWVEREEAGAIAEIDGQPIAAARFDEYVGETLSGQPGGSDEPPGDELLSRLLDRFLEEELVVREAARRGMEASEEEISEELSHLEGPEGPGARDAKAASAREAARRAVLLRKFRDEQVLADIQISDEEIARHYDEHRDQFQQTERLVLRQILLDDEGEARKLREELSADPSRFQEVAEEKSLAPDAGRGAAYDEASLPPEVIEAVKDVPQGAVSRICKSPEGIRLFLVEKREAAREVTREEATDQIRVLLMQERSRQAYEKILEDLRTRAGVVIRPENLPFRYDKQEAGGDGSL